jgi:hypothetical protein
MQCLVPACTMRARPRASLFVHVRRCARARQEAAPPTLTATHFFPADRARTAPGKSPLSDLAEKPRADPRLESGGTAFVVRRRSCPSYQTEPSVIVRLSPAARVSSARLRGLNVRSLSPRRSNETMSGKPVRICDGNWVSESQPCRDVAHRPTVYMSDAAREAGCREIILARRTADVSHSPCSRTPPQCACAKPVTCECFAAAGAN